MEGGRKADLAAAYHKEYQAFIQKLQKFHENRGSLFRQAPTFSGRPIDLYVLYKTVTSLGGFTKVTDDAKWPQVARCFDLPTRSTNVCYALRQHYIRYLESYEKTNYLGEDNDFATNDSRLFSGFHSSLPGMSPNVAGRLDISSLFGPLGEPRISNFNKLVFSLTSGLQNEVDFALNICMLLSNVTNSIFNLAKSPKIVDLMLAHVGVCESDEYWSLHHEWYKNSRRSFTKAWHLLLSSNTMAVDMFKEEMDHRLSNQETQHDWIPCLSSNIDIEQHRIHQVAVILYNFSFERINAMFLSESSCCLKFLLMAICCEVPTIRRLALDTLDNLAEDIILKDCECLTTQAFLQILDSLLASADRFQSCKAMMVLAKLCSTVANKRVIDEGLGQGSYEAIVITLTIPDIQLILSSLDLLYALSALGQTTTTSIASVHGGIGILVSLVSVHAESYGNEAIAGFRIVENKNSISAQQAHQEKASKAHSTGASTVKRADVSTSSHVTSQSAVDGGLQPARATDKIARAPPAPPRTELNVKQQTASTLQWSTLLTPSSSGDNADKRLTQPFAKLTENGRTNGPLVVNDAGVNSKAPTIDLQLTTQSHASPLLPPEGAQVLSGVQQQQQHLTLSLPHSPSTPLPPAAPGQGNHTTIDKQPNSDAKSEGLHRQPQGITGQQIIVQCYTILEQIKREIQQHFLQFHFHRQQIETIQSQLQQAMQQQQQQQSSSAAVVMPANIMGEVQSKVKSHHAQMQAHYNKLQQLQILSQQIQLKINQEQERMRQSTDANEPTSTALPSPQQQRVPKASVPLDGLLTADAQSPRNGPLSDGLQNGLVRPLNGRLRADGVAMDHVEVSNEAHGIDGTTADPGLALEDAIKARNNYKRAIHSKEPELAESQAKQTKLLSPGAHSHSTATTTLTNAAAVNGHATQSDQNATHNTSRLATDWSNATERPTQRVTSKQETRPRSQVTAAATASHVCRWADCKSSSSTMDDLLQHMIMRHTSNKDEERMICRVTDCAVIDKIPMNREAMINHFKRAHCVDRTLLPPIRRPPAAHAELLAHHADSFNTDEDESPVTRSIRLSAALILRNIARHSPTGKRLLLPYQDRLASSSMATSEASAALASCLFELSRDNESSYKTAPLLLMPDRSIATAWPTS